MSRAPLCLSVFQQSFVLCAWRREPLSMNRPFLFLFLFRVFLLNPVVVPDSRSLLPFFTQYALSFLANPLPLSPFCLSIP